jgi:hypothetical protein
MHILTKRLLFEPSQLHEEIVERKSLITKNFSRVPREPCGPPRRRLSFQGVFEVQAATGLIRVNTMAPAAGATNETPGREPLHTIAANNIHNFPCFQRRGQATSRSSPLLFIIIDTPCTAYYTRVHSPDGGCVGLSLGPSASTELN